MWDARLRKLSVLMMPQSATEPAAAELSCYQLTFKYSLIAVWVTERAHDP